MSSGKKQKRPVSTKTQSLLDQLKRSRGERELSKPFLIVCEDDKSAPDYFKALRKHFSLSATSIEVAGSGGNTQPIQVVEEAIQRKRRAAGRNSGTVPFAQVWCVIDGDYGDKISNARNKADSQGVELAISTMCFEYWVLLHFEENDKATLDCDALVRKLKRKPIPDYQKGSCDFRDVVKNVRDACKRAEKLRRPGIERGDLPENQNPCSEVYRLINEILKQSDQETVMGVQPSASQEAARGSGGHRDKTRNFSGRKGSRKCTDASE